MKWSMPLERRPIRSPNDYNSAARRYEVDQMNVISVLLSTVHRFYQRILITYITRTIWIRIHIYMYRYVYVLYFFEIYVYVYIYISKRVGAITWFYFDQCFVTQIENFTKRKRKKKKKKVKTKKKENNQNRVHVLHAIRHRSIHR